MTLTATLVKLKWSLAMSSKRNDIMKKMKEDIAGEIIKQPE